MYIKYIHTFTLYTSVYIHICNALDEGALYGLCKGFDIGMLALFEFGVWARAMLHYALSHPAIKLQWTSDATLPI